MTKIRDEKLMLAFGDKVRKTRSKAGISQYELAALCNVEQSQITRIENGKINTTLSTIFALSNAFEMRMSELMDFESD